MARRPSSWRRLALGGSAAVPRARRARAEIDAPEADVACVAHGVEMSGRLVVERPLRIEGEFRGEIESTSSVLVVETGTAEASIRARSVEIRGAVVGDVKASREVVIFATGRLHGDVETPSFEIARGATFNGRTRMYRPERSLPADASSPDLV